MPLQLNMQMFYFRRLSWPDRSPRNRGTHRILVGDAKVERVR